MSHELSFKDGKAELALADTGAWHNFGVVLDGAFDSLTAMKIACPWEAEKERLFLANGTPTEQYAILRSDTNNIIGYVGQGYEIVQPYHMFDFTDSWISESKNKFESAGALRGGSVLFCLARVGEINVLGSGDIHRTYLAFLNSFDGSLSTQAYLTTTRIVCMNTLQMSLSNQKGSSVKFRHTKEVHSKLKAAAALMEGQIATEALLKEKLELLATKRLTKKDYTLVLDTLFPSTSTRATNVKGAITTLYESNDNDAFYEFKGTSYALLNAITNYTDHEREVRIPKGSSTTVQDARADSAILGTGAKLKEEAFKLLVEITEKGDTITKKYFDQHPVTA